MYCKPVYFQIKALLSLKNPWLPPIFFSEQEHLHVLNFDFSA